jgi:predicted nucleic acid-binding protein
MIIYLDSSGLVKKYIVEADSDQFARLWEMPVTVSISAVGYAEIMAAFGRRRREGSISEETYRTLVTTFKEAWFFLDVLDVSGRLNEIVDRLTYQYPLRGFDSIHLASAIEMRNISGQEVLFASADKRLRMTASQEQLSVYPEQ